MPASRLHNFHRLGLGERVALLKEMGVLDDGDVDLLCKGLPLSVAERMAENVISEQHLPLGIATNFKINGRGYLIPMATEEPSVIAAASHAAKLALPEGFVASASRPVMRGQIQLANVPSPDDAIRKIMNSRDELIRKANGFAGSLPSLGGGVIDLGARIIGGEERMVVVEFYVDTRDAMGANAINTIVERMSSEVEGIAGGEAILRILSNLATERIAKAKVTYKRETIGGEGVVDRIIGAYRFACYDIYRAATHNKGIMNGVTAVALATSNDTRAVEAGAHAYASISGKYLPLSKWVKDSKGDLVGEIEMPLAVGILGGAIKVNPIAQISLKILGVRSATELAEVICAVGLAQNFAALYALVTEGIQKGHMKLHARSMAIAAGASGDDVDRVVDELLRGGDIRFSKAKEVTERLQLRSTR
ncbi:MAG: hydroxymethylglutaryl-CoA reductase, degradative [Candidatus Methanomethylicia archaeon]|nr:hydroxymethylglutaryl-CoA reductase, degradative [Candidatus Methanomethylicia archaeon]